MKFKEIFKKIKSKKYCLTALLLASLLIFAVLGGLNESKSGKNQAYAATAPAVKNLDLNGVRYNYQTSLNELRKYGIFNFISSDPFFQIHENTEGVNNLTLVSRGTMSSTTNNDVENIKQLISNNFKLKVNEKEYNGGYTYNTDEVEYPSFTWQQNGNEFNLSKLTSIEIDFENLFVVPFIAEYLTKETQPEISVTFFYIPNNLTNPSLEDLYKYSIKKGYTFSDRINYTFNNLIINNYRLVSINVGFSLTRSKEQYIYLPTPFPNSDWLEYSNQEPMESSAATIDNIKFLNNSESNIISYDILSYDYNGHSNSLYQGNILLSTQNYDRDFINALLSSPFVSGPLQEIDGGFYLGGKFNYNKKINGIVYQLRTAAGTAVAYVNAEDAGNSNYYTNGLWSYMYGIGGQNVLYKAQNQLIYLENANDLKAEFNNTTYNALSAQVEDILYNVNYVGDIEEIEFNEKVEEDLENLLKTVGLGAFVGLLIGLAFGNPLLGAAIGAAIGLVVAIIPLIIDGLQAIFGKQFLTGLYNFFKSITQFFVNIVDTIINFLMSIITNPFVLVFIVIAAIIFLIFYFKNK